MGVRRDEVMPGPRRVGGARGPAGRARSFAPHPLLTFDLGVPRLQPQPPLPGQAPVRGGNPEASCLLRALVSPSARWGRESAAARPAARALGSPGSFGSLPAPGPRVRARPGPPRAVPSAPRGGAGWARRARDPAASPRALGVRARRPPDVPALPPSPELVWGAEGRVHPAVSTDGAPDTRGSELRARERRGPGPPAPPAGAARRPLSGPAALCGRSGRAGSAAAAAY